MAVARQFRVRARCKVLLLSGGAARREEDMEQAGIPTFSLGVGLVVGGLKLAERIDHRDDLCQRQSGTDSCRP